MKLRERSMQRSRAPAFLGIAFFLFSLAGARAAIIGGIQGFATDAGSHPLAGVTVSVTSPSGYGATVTGASGFYSLNGLPLDTYAVAFSKDGYLPQTIRGITVVADQSVRVNAQLKTRLTTIASVTSRDSTSLVQAGVTADTYVVDEDRLKNVQGTQQAPSGFQAVYSVPGVIPDGNGAPTIRGGALADVSFLYDGVALADPLFGVPLNLVTSSSFSLNGTNGFQISTGGYDVSLGNANSGILSQIIKRGTSPARGQATTGFTSAISGHEFSFDYGGASQDNRFSYYAAFSSSRNAIGYGDLKTLLPLQLGAFTYTALDNGVINLFYRFGKGNRDELQFLANYSTTSVVANDLADPLLAPYASNNGNVQFASDPFGLGPQSPGHPSVFLSDYTTLYPGQKSYRQNIGYADTVEIPTSFVQKLNFKRQIGPSSYFEARAYRVGEYGVARQPFNTGSFTDYYSLENVTGIGEAFDYLSQLDSRHELSLGGEAVYYHNEFYTLTPSLEPAFEPLEDLGCPQIAAAITAGKLTPTPFFSSTPGVGGCYIAPLNRAMSLAVPGLDLPTDAAHAPLSTYVDDAFHADVPLYRYGVWIKDRYQPTDRLAMTLGLRWDKEDIPLPKDAAFQNTTYYIDDRGNVVTVPGRPIGSDVTQPSGISPRFAASYQFSPRDAVRFSYGKNIQFAPLAEFINVHYIPGTLHSCSIASGCFLPLPGYGRTNFVTNLYQQVLLDLNTNQIPQYQPVSPQTSVNLDFSYEHDFGQGSSLRITPYYSRGSNYVVGSSPLLFTLPSGRPIFAPMTETNAGKNENTGVELALQHTSSFGFSGSLNLTYDNTLANYDSDFFPTINGAALAANHFYHVTYIAPVTGLLNVAYNTRAGFHTSVTVSYQSGFRYGVGKETFVFAPNGIPVQVLNTDLASNSGVAGAYYLTNPSNPGTVFAPNVVASRGTPEGNDPGSLFGPPITIVNVTLSQELGSGSHKIEVGVRAQNLFGNYTPAVIPSNPYYGFSGFGNNGLPSGVNGNACARGQRFACEPFQYNYSPFPYELEQNGAPRAFTLYASIKL